MKSLIALSCLFLIFGCDVRSQLPEKMPDDVSISLNQTGGMMRAHKRITVTADKLEFDELTGGGAPQIKWTKLIDRKDAEKLYATFVENRFDMIRNDKRTEIVYDAGSEHISLSLGIGRTVSAVYGKNSPMSGTSLRHFQAVSKAIDDLLTRYQDAGSAELTEGYLQGTWRAAGETPDRHAWFLEWTFDNGRFKQMGYPPITQEGKYRLIAAEGDKLTIELFDQNGTFGKETQRIEISADAGRLTIQNMKGFSKVTDPISK